MWRELEPRASRLWIRYVPRRWPAGGGEPWLDVAVRRIVWPATSRAAGVSLPSSLPGGDVVLLPPLEKGQTQEKLELGSKVVASGGICCDQRRATAGENTSAAAGAILVTDLLRPMLEKDLAAFGNIAKSSIALVPLLPGVSSEEAVWEPALTALAFRSPLAVIGIAPELPPVDRRRLVERLGEESFERVHHSGATSADLERRFARAAAAAGLNPFFERPAAKLPPRAARNRRIAAVLFEAGERWLALGRGEADAAALLAAARHVESAAQEIEALARERQLALLPFLSPLARETVGAFVEAGESALLAELRAEWVGAGVAA